jgi:hypothetical protein
MSTGLNCELIEYRPNTWYYLLEDWGAPKNSWDWREYSTAYGPFKSQRLCEEHLFAKHSNPGGYSVSHYDSSYTPDAVLIEAVKKALR